MGLFNNSEPFKNLSPEDQLKWIDKNKSALEEAFKANERKISLHYLERFKEKKFQLHEFQRQMSDALEMIRNARDSVIHFFESFVSKEVAEEVWRHIREEEDQKGIVRSNPHLSPEIYNFQKEWELQKELIEYSIKRLQHNVVTKLNIEVHEKLEEAAELLNKKLLNPWKEEEKRNFVDFSEQQERMAESNLRSSRESAEKIESLKHQYEQDKLNKELELSRVQLEIEALKLKRMELRNEQLKSLNVKR